MEFMAEKKEVLDWLEENTPRFTYISDRIWEKPEIMWQETFACGLQADFLENEGFRIERGVAGMETAFIGEWGEGKPVLALIGEYDALPGLSQKAQPSQDAIVDGGPGHGCGHNMLGTAALAAAVSIQKWLQRTGRIGTIRYYGCPAEEGGGGKVFMARAGDFDDLDAALTWHPGSFNMPGKGRTVATISSSFRFRGVSAHAGAAPHEGRSALDAVELMNVGANYLREHVTEDTRIQYVITNGGQAANIVPETAEVEYLLRAEKTAYLEEVLERVRNIARGAALMTDTSFEETVGEAYANLIQNHYLADLMIQALETIGPIEFTEEEVAFAQKINDSYPGMNEDAYEDFISYYKPPENIRSKIESHKDKPLLGINLSPLDEDRVARYATDVGDLSQITPTGGLSTACFTTKSPGHSWSNVVTGGMSIGHKGMMHAAKTLALTSMDLLTDPAHLQNARSEFERVMGGKGYQSIMPDDVKPPGLS